MGTYHVVCHDCEEEAVVGDEETAERLLTEHVAELGHRGSYADITRRSTETEKRPSTL